MKFNPKSKSYTFEHDDGKCEALSEAETSLALKQYQYDLKAKKSKYEIAVFVPAGMRLGMRIDVAKGQDDCIVGLNLNEKPRFNFVRPGDIVVSCDDVVLGPSNLLFYSVSFSNKSKTHKEIQN